MESVAVASTSTGLITLGISVCHGLLQYYASWKNAGESTESMYRSVEALAKTLLVLKRSIDGPNVSVLLTEDAVHRVKESIVDFEDSIRRLRAKFKNIKDVDGKKQSRSEKNKAQFRRARYPFTEGTLTRLKEISSDLRDDLLFAMETLQMWDPRMI